MDPSKANMSPMKDLTIHNITENAIHVNSQTGDARLTYVFERLISHLHAFVRETRLSTQEWSAGLRFLEATGQLCKDGRKEFNFLSDVLGLSLLVDLINHPRPSGTTEVSLLGPAHLEDSPHMAHGEGISHDPRGKPCLVLCSVKDSAGKPIEDVKIYIWETDSTGTYDVLNPDLDGVDGRCTMYSDEKGLFWFKAIQPPSYPVPDGAVCDLLALLHRQPWRPAHIHFILGKPGYDQLTTAIYIRGDPFEAIDPVFGVQESLLINTDPADEAVAKQYGVDVGIPVWRYDFVLPTESEVRQLREEEAKQALADMGHGVQWVNGLPVPDVD